MMVMSTLGGISGNLVILPVCFVFFRNSPHSAVAHTSVFSAVTAVTRLIIETTQGWTDSRNRSVNCDIGLLVAGPAIFGSFMGVELNKIAKDALILSRSGGTKERKRSTSARTELPKWWIVRFK
jgi:uncharacterized membrane protein YfcA